eukprot:154373-Chlamydomonas_euryale.AAC.5
MNVRRRPECAGGRVQVPDAMCMRCGAEQGERCVRVSGVCGGEVCGAEQGERVQVPDAMCKRDVRTQRLQTAACSPHARMHSRHASPMRMRVA